MKGGISFPLVLVVTIIVIAIVIALAYLFLFNTKENIESSFGSIAESVADFACSGLGIARGAVCPG